MCCKPVEPATQTSSSLLMFTRDTELWCLHLHSIVPRHLLSVYAWCNFHRLIKLASSQLNYLIAIGAIILYLDSVLFVIPSAGPNVATAICNITPWLTAIGYSLCYGTILMKMARVYYIFNNPTANKKVRGCNADCVHVHGTKNCLCTA